MPHPYGIRIDDAIRKQREVEVVSEKGREARKQTGALRESAACTDGILTEAVVDLEVGLEVVAGRLCTATDRGRPRPQWLN